MAPGQVIRIDSLRSSSRSAGTLPRNGGVTNVLQQGDLTELSFGYGSIDVVFPRWAVSPECHWKACDFGGPDPFLDAGRVFAVIQTSVDGRSDGTGASGRAAHIGQWAGRGRCVAPSIRPCWRRWYPTTGARGWCSRRNRSGDKSRHPRAQTTPVEGSPHGPVGRRTGEPRRCRVVRGREDLPRETIRDLSTTPHQSMASTNQLPACSAWLQSAPPRLDRQARTASAALECGSAAAGRSKRVVPHCFPGGPLAP